MDAAASLPGGRTHLIISCKSYPYSAACERGEFGEVRNIAVKLHTDARSALLFVHRLGELELRARYSIPKEAVLVPVVVTPRIMYRNEATCSERVLPEIWAPRLGSGFGELVGLLQRIVRSEDTRE